MTDAQIDPTTTALLVMDYQPGIIGRLPDPDATLAHVERAIATMRERGGHIGYVRVAFADGEVDAIPETSPMRRLAVGDPAAAATLHADAPQTQVHERLAPRDGDIVVRKVRVGAFSTTDLAQQLRARGVDTLVLAGLSTSGVVLSTVRDGADRDFRIYVLSDASADPDPEVHEFLTTRILPRQAEVITTNELDALLAGR
jgi:nicotinamidase-related amidase